MNTIPILCLAIFVTNCAATNLRNPTAPSSIQTTVSPSERASTPYVWNPKENHRSKPTNPSVPGSHPVEENSLHSGSRTKPTSAFKSVKPRPNNPQGASNYAPTQSYRNIAPNSVSSAYKNGFRPSFVQPANTQNPVYYSQAYPIRGIESQQNSHFSLPYYETYFNNPSVYNVVADSSKLSTQTKPQQNLHGLTQGPLNEKKVVGGLEGFNNFAQFYGRLGQGSRGQNQVGANSPYLSFYANKYSPDYENVRNYVPSALSAERVTQNVTPGDQASVNVNGKKLPIHRPNLSGYLQAFESQPLLLSPNFDYQPQASLDFNFGVKPGGVQSGGSDVQYVSPIIGYQAQVVPIQTASSTPEFPQYRGASVNVFPGVNGPKPAAIYEPIQNQPQLHFGANGAVNPIKTHQAVYHEKPSGEIRTDVEVIKKKKPTPPPSQQDDDDDEESDEGYKQIENEYGRYPSDDEDDGSQTNKYQERHKPESNFKPSSAQPFKTYDEYFGKYSKQGNRDEEDDEESSKNRNYSSREEDEDEESYPKFHADYSSKKPRYQKYETSIEEDESKNQETQKETSEEDSDYEINPKGYYRTKDFDREFEESYRKELPQNKYVHVKGVPEIDESQYISGNTKSKTQQKGNNKHHSRQEESNEPKTQGSRNYRIKSRSNNYRDSDGHSSNVSVNKTPRIVYEESFGYKTHHKGYPKHLKKVDTSEKKLPIDKPSKEFYQQTTKTPYKLSKAKTSGISTAYENEKSFSLPSGDDRKSSESPPEDTYRFPGIVVKDSSNLAARTVSQRHLPNGSRKLTTQEVLQTLTGI